MEVAIRDQLPQEGCWVVVDHSMPYSIKAASTEWWERTSLWPMISLSPLADFI
jgi:hypothetical protein